MKAAASAASAAGGDAAALASVPAAAERLARAIAADWRTAVGIPHGLSAADQALCLFAEKLTSTPGTCGRADVETLRAIGFDDVAIHDAAQVVGYFNYINRVADALGVDLEPEMRRGQ